MNDRPMAERHYWSDRGKNYIADISEDGRIAAPLPPEEIAPACLPDYVAELHRKDGVSACVRELLRLVAERDEAREALQEMEDAHSEETGARCRAEDEREALGKALLIAYEWAAGYPLGGAMDQTAVTTVYAAAESALRDAGLLLEGK